MSSLHGDFILQRSMPAPALENAQAALQGVQVLMTRQGGRDGWMEGGRGERVIHWQQGAVQVTRDWRARLTALLVRSNRDSHGYVRETTVLWESSCRLVEWYGRGVVGNPSIQLPWGPAEIFHVGSDRRLKVNMQTRDRNHWGTFWVVGWQARTPPVITDILQSLCFYGINKVTLFRKDTTIQDPR